MNQFILPFAVDRDVRSLPAYTQFLSSQKNYLDRKYNIAFKALGYQSNGLNLLKYILGFADIPFLRTIGSNVDRYTNHIRDIKKELMNIFDKVGRESHGYNLFFDNQKVSIPEYILPLDGTGLISRLPLHSSNWEDWEKVKPLYIWSHDSRELTTNIVHSQVVFTHDQPTYALSLLSVESLILKYLVWLEYKCDYEQDSEISKLIPEMYFLHKYVLCPCIYDLADIWLLNNLHSLFNVMDVKDLDWYKSEYLQQNTQYGRIVTHSKKGFESLWYLMEDIRKNVRPEALLSSKLLFSGSIHDRIRMTDRELGIPIHSQYEYLRWMRDKATYRLFMDTWNLRQAMPSAITVDRIVGRDHRRMLNRRPWNVCQSVSLKKSIEKEMVDMTPPLR